MSDRSNPWQLQAIVCQLRAARNQWRTQNGRVSGEQGGRELPSRAAMADILEALCGALFPMRLGPVDLREESEDFYVGHTLDVALNALLTQARLELRYVARQGGLPDEGVDATATLLIQDFALALPGLRSILDTDVLAAYHGDPAARSVDEVLLCYPGILAVIHHRLAHHLYRAGLPLLARISAEIAHSATGIDIHPGAQIGRSFFIDHGTGVVIGETAIIGERVRIYQAVTLGAKRFPADESGQLQKGHPRHPIVEDDVVIYAGATILGRITIGQGSTIGGNVWLTRSVPAGSNLTQANLLHDDGTQK
ncbi:serine acetyltransferase [Pseudomonas sp. FSL R10-0056]|uniref:serine O-acetyltransferase n=2 Tax=Pseudomonas TaxID=286 RepID=A0ABT4WV21_PSEFR|nr:MULTISPECIES: serine O-acetyltransferase EpsC [Pseudomonas]MCH4884564.1 serine acetyltransferase [Pseudomonas sp. TMW22080]MQT64752.1 serine acetyltransferase [Pseudomonas sp. FSL R10-0056]MQT66933.1 serine acetyltransferase [Pseudomonas sp. FSL R10-0071]MQT84047.1 serine acetyltransferase [Pseudomonas sp. FSL R10-2964]MQU46450.1 serine acetyltransferase [Pseudomonas sp. FSL A6-1183]NMY54888.1 serine acetyltransferase [Pseudomonas sp. WS 5051]